MTSEELKAKREALYRRFEDDLKMLDADVLDALVDEEQEYIAYYAYEGYDWSEETTTEPWTKCFESLEQALWFFAEDVPAEWRFRIEGPKDKATGNRPVAW